MAQTAHSVTDGAGVGHKAHDWLTDGRRLLQPELCWVGGDDDDAIDQ